MARRAHAYPQITLTAADLVDGEILSAPSGVTAADALRLARRRRVRVLACGARQHVLADDLARAMDLGLGELPARDLARPLPIVTARTPELAVRRALSEGAPAVIVPGRGTISRPAAPRTMPVRARLEKTLSPPTRALLAEISRVAAAQGARAFVAGGLVRDAWRGAAAGGDLDVVVEGDGPAVARALADALRGTLVEHERFLTASVRAASHGRIDVATARSERYDAPGALPRVLPAPIGLDLQRRDFAVNAMAVEVTTDAWELLDPFGGLVDLERRRLRILHPLSFVEDPTRILRGARYAARLELRPDPWSTRCQALALAADQPSTVAEAMTGRLGLNGEPLSELRRALTEAPALARRVADAAPSAAGRALRAASAAALVALHLAGGAARERVEWWLAQGRGIEPILGGDEVIGLGVARGPAVAAALAALRDARLDGRVVDRASEIDYVRTWTSTREGRD